MKGVFPYITHVCLVKHFHIGHSASLLVYVFRSVGHANTISQIDISNKKATGNGTDGLSPFRTNPKWISGCSTHLGNKGWQSWRWRSEQFEVLVSFAAGVE